MTAARHASRFSRPSAASAYLSEITSPCSVSFKNASTVPNGWARIASADGPPPRPTVPPRPWKSQVGGRRGGPRRVAQRPLCFEDLPLRGRHPGVLVRVGVPEHHLLRVPAALHDPPVHRIGEEIVKKVPRLAELGDGLEQRHEPDAGIDPARADQTRLTGEHRRSEDIVGTLGHRDDVALDHAVAEAVEGGCDRAEGPEGLRGLLAQPDERRHERTAAVELAGEQPGPFSPIETRVRPVELADSIEHFAEHDVVLLRVLADVERRDRESERADETRCAPDDPGRDRSPAVRRERIPHDTEIVDELVDAGVVDARQVGESRRHPGCTGVDEALTDVRALQAVRLFCVEPDEAVVHLGKCDPVSRHRRSELFGHRDDLDRVGERLDALVDEPEELAETELVLDEQDRVRDFKGVTNGFPWSRVAADPMDPNRRSDLAKSSSMPRRELLVDLFEDERDPSRRRAGRDRTRDVVRLVLGSGSSGATQLVGLGQGGKHLIVLARGAVRMTRSRSASLRSSSSFGTSCATSRTLVSTDRRADSVGWAVKTGRNSIRRIVSATRSASMPRATIRSSASRSQVSPSVARCKQCWSAAVPVGAARPRWRAGSRRRTRAARSAGLGRDEASERAGSPARRHRPGVVLGTGELGGRADLLDEIDEAGTFGAGDLLAEQGREQPDVPTELRMARLGVHRVVRRYGVADIERLGGERFHGSRHFLASYASGSASGSGARPSGVTSKDGGTRRPASPTPPAGRTVEA